MAETVFWVCLALLGYTYLGYPFLLWLWARSATRPVRKAPVVPSVSVVIAARNEEAHIARRIENCLALEYPRDCLEVIVVSDGSTDRTADIVGGYTDRRVLLVSLPRRVGKAAALNRGVAEASGEIVALTDARQTFEPNAVRELVANFGDQDVGAVGGELVLMEGPADTPRHATGLYWQYETWIRKTESRIDSTVGASGSIYAIRRRLFVPLPAGTILDDVLIPMRIVQQGYRVVFEEWARAFDATTVNFEQEFRRKVRTLAGNYQILRLAPELLSPGGNRLLFQYCSHKVTRLLAPLFLIALLGASAVLADGVYGVALGLQMLGYALAWMGWQLRRFAVRVPVMSVLTTFVMLNYAALLGLILFLKGRCDEQDLWVKT